jgi:transcriptional regulator with XRE-family HTH domain
VKKTIHSPDYRRLLRLLKEARSARRLTQEDVARELGWTQSFVSKCERGERRLDVLELAALARVYRRPLTHFLRFTSRVQ